MLIRNITGVRVGFVITAVACYFGTLAICAAYPNVDQREAISALQWLVAAVGAAIVGDTIRPSGQSTSAFSPQTPPDPSPEAIDASDKAAKKTTK